MQHADICFVAAKEKYDFIFDAIKTYGFELMIPYTDKNIVLRIMRELWFRLKLPYRELWFNKRIKSITQKTIIVKDSLICNELLSYIKKENPDAKIIIMYFNRVDKTFSASEASRYACELWSYNYDDCKLYNMRHMGDYYFQQYRIQNNSLKTMKYDAIYLGRDKGRARYLFELRDEMKKQGLKVYLHITPDRSFLRFIHSYYKSTIPYQDYMELLSQSKALINIMPEGQSSITPRDMEVIFNNKKGITNNKGIKGSRFYHPNRFFILGEDDLCNISQFMEAPFPPVEEEELKELEFDRMVFKMFNSE